MVAQPEIDATFFTIFFFGLMAVPVGEPGKMALFEEMSDELVGQGSVDAPGAAIYLGEFPGVLELSGGIIGGAEPDADAGAGETLHGPGVYAVGHDDFAAVELDVGKKPLVAFNQSTRDQGVWAGYGGNNGGFGHCGGAAGGDTAVAVVARSVISPVPMSIRRMAWVTGSSDSVS